MLRSLLFIMALAGWLLMTPTLLANTHPITGDPISTTYTVEIDGKPIPVTTYDMREFVIFKWEKPGLVRITRLDGKPIAEHRIRPVRMGLVGKANGNVFEFQMDHPKPWIISLDKSRKLVIVPKVDDPDFPDLQSPLVFDMKKLGADATGKQDNTQLIQKTIDALPVGGTIYFPPGVYRSGSINLKSDMTLYLDDNAVLKGSADHKQHQFHTSYLYFVRAQKAQNLKILGNGVIDANGHDVRQAWQKERNVRKIAGRCLVILDTQNLTIRNVTVRESYSWNVQLIRCDNVHVDTLRIFSSGRNSNGDGLNPDGCVDVLIENCLILSEDDSISPKAAWKPTRSPKNYHVRNCILWAQNATGIRLGDETNSEEFSHMLFEDIDILRANTMIRLFVYDGAYMSNITCRNLWVEEYSMHVQDLGFEELIRFEGANKRTDGQTYLMHAYVHKRNDGSKIGRISDVLLENIHAPRAVKTVLTGMQRPDGHISISNVVMRNCTVAGVCARSAADLKASNTQFANPVQVECTCP